MERRARPSFNLKPLVEREATYGPVEKSQIEPEWIIEADGMNLVGKFCTGQERARTSLFLNRNLPACPERHNHVDHVKGRSLVVGMPEQSGAIKILLTNEEQDNSVMALLHSSVSRMEAPGCL
jgi:hypothetical protein